MDGTRQIERRGNLGLMTDISDDMKSLGLLSKIRENIFRAFVM